MHEIKCPNCGKSFTLDEAGYAAILKQVRDDEFSKDLSQRLHQYEQEKQKKEFRSSLDLILYYKEQMAYDKKTGCHNR